MLDTSDQLSNTENVPEFRLYLLEQVMLMKENRRNGNNRILISSIYEKTGIDPPEIRTPKQRKKSEKSQKAENVSAAQRKARAKDCEKFEGILKSWKKKGEIKGFKVIRENGNQNGTKIAYDIILHNEQTKKAIPTERAERT